MISTEETKIEKLQALCLRWNQAATRAGAAGSEFIDHPERVFECLEKRKEMDRKMAHRNGQLGLEFKPKSTPDWTMGHSGDE